MGITGPGDPLMMDPDWRPEERHCLYCGKSVYNGNPFVYWHNGWYEKGVVWHAVCAKYMADNLRKDGEGADAKRPHLHIE